MMQVNEGGFLKRVSRGSSKRGLAGARGLAMYVPVVLPMVMIMALATAGAAQAQVLLEADFDDKVVDAPIGLGGAVVGEPVASGAPGASEIVRPSPFSSPSLEVADTSITTSGAPTFNFLDDEEVTSGPVTIAMRLWVPVAESFSVLIREPRFASASFLTLRLQEDRNVLVSDADPGGARLIGTYPEDRPFPLVIVFDMDAGTYDIELDGQVLVDDETHGVADRGVGSVRVGVGFDNDLDGAIYVDELLAFKGILPLFADGFEGD